MARGRFLESERCTNCRASASPYSSFETRYLALSVFFDPGYGITTNPHVACIHFGARVEQHCLVERSRAGNARPHCAPCERGRGRIIVSIPRPARRWGRLTPRRDRRGQLARADRVHPDRRQRRTGTRGERRPPLRTSTRPSARPRMGMSTSVRMPTVVGRAGFRRRSASSRPTVERGTDCLGRQEGSGRDLTMHRMGRGRRWPRPFADSHAPLVRRRTRYSIEGAAGAATAVVTSRAW